MKKRINFFNEGAIRNELTLEEGFEKFINHKIALSKADETIKYYTQRFAKFSLYIEKETSVKYVHEIAEDNIDDYIAYMRGKNPNLSNVTINNHLRAIRCALYYFMEKGYMGYFKIQLTKTKKNPKAGYTYEEQEKLLKKPDINKCTFPQYRNWVMICHLLASGNRSRTIRGIKNKDVDLKRRIIMLMEVKNDEIYEMPITSEYYPILSEYMSIRKGEPDDYLFCSQYGGQLTASGLRAVMRRYNQKHGVDTTSLHRFRNSFAQNWVLNGGCFKKLQYALGHSDPTMVDEYVKIYGRQLKDDFSKYTPLSNFKGKIDKKKMTINS